MKGAFPVEILDQETLWIDPQGRRHDIPTLESDEALLWAIDYLLANARHLRDAWTAKTKQTYDPEQRARRWMLDRRVVRALMRRLVVLERKRQAQEAFNELYTKTAQGSGDGNGVDDSNRASPLRFLPFASSHTLQRSG